MGFLFEARGLGALDLFPGPIQAWVHGRFPGAVLPLGAGALPVRAWDWRASAARQCCVKRLEARLLLLVYHDGLGIAAALQRGYIAADQIPRGHMAQFR